MLTAIFFVCFVTVSALAQGLLSPVANPPTIRWETDLNVAMTRSEQEQRPIFLHFIGSDCLPAQQMENEVFIHPNIVTHLNTNFVMVKINASDNAALAQKFAVAAIPTDLILKPNGQLIHRRTGGITAERFSEYLVFLQKTIQSDQNPPSVLPAVPAQTTVQTPNPAGLPHQVPPPTVPQRDMTSVPETARDPFVQQPPTVAGMVSSSPPVVNQLRTVETAKPAVEYTSNLSQAPLRESAPPMTTMTPAAVSALPIEEPTHPKMTVEVPLALEGFCPVTLCTEERWISGNPAYCTMYQGHIFRFASFEALVTFARNPAGYIPVAMGDDIVWMVDRNKRVNGNRKFGAWFQDRVFLFASQETLDAFAARPEYYTEIAIKYEMARKEQPVPLVY